MIPDAATCLNLQPVPWVPLRGWGRVFPFLFAAQLSNEIRTGRHDWLHLRITPHWPIVRALARVRVPMSIEHIEDFLPSRSVGILSGKFKLAFTNSENTAQLIRSELGMAEGTIATKPEGIEPDVFAGPVDRVRVRRQLGLDGDTFLVAHASSFRWHHDFDTVLEAMKRLEFKSKIVFCGAGLRQDEVRARAAVLGVQAVFLGALAQSDLAQVLRAADACVDALIGIVQKIGNLRSSKLWDYMASGIPTIETVDAEKPLPEWAPSYLSLVPPEKPDAMADALRQIFRNPAAWAARAACAKNWVFANKSWTVVTEQAVEAMQKSLGEQG